MSIKSNRYKSGLDNKINVYVGVLVTINGYESIKCKNRKIMWDCGFSSPVAATHQASDK